MNVGLVTINVGQGECIRASLAFDECKPQVRHEVA
jgi:hypothetical protein